MILVAGQTDAVTIDPTLLALIPIVSVLLTIGAGLVGAAIQGRREHRRWLRERRYEAYTHAFDIASTVRAVAIEVVDTVQAIEADKVPLDMREATAARLAERMAYLSGLSDDVSERMAPLVILGPEAVGNAYVALVDSMGPPEAMDIAKVNAAESALSEAMRNALAVKDY
jgi:hypothetical protein